MKGRWFLKRVASAIERRSLLAPGQGALVGVSGGPDSVALLHALVTLAPRYRWQLEVGHLDHGLRGREAEADAEYVRNLASELGLRFAVERADVSGEARREGLSLEDAGRRARYGFFRRVATTRGLARVALGHTLDDQAETVLLRLLRGAGVEGLAGIPWTRPLAESLDLVIVRPLLETTREEVLEYCSELGLTPRLDRSNESLDYWRNRVRLLLIPFLEQAFAPNVKELLARTAAICQDEASLMARDTEAALATVVAEMGEGLAVLDGETLLDQPRARARRIVRRALAGAGLKRGLEYGHVESVLELAARGGEGAALDLPGGFSAVLAGGRLTAARGAAAPEGRVWEGAALLVVPGETEVPELGVTFQTRWLEGEEARREVAGGLPPEVAVCDALTLDFPLVARSRREGDRFRPLGMTGTRKLKDYLMSAAVPRAERDRIPLIVSAGQIVWVAGYRSDDRFRVTDKTTLGLRLECRRLEPDRR